MPISNDMSATPTSLEVVEAFDDFLRSFEAFKEANDERLTQIETQVGTDVVTEEKVRRINRSLDEQKRTLDHLLMKAHRPQIGGEGYAPAASEHKSAFEAYVRRGDTGRIARLEEKALSAGSGPDGGYLVPQPTETEILRRLADVSPIRAIADVRQMTSSVYKRPFTTSGPATGWVGETDARATPNSPVLAELSFPAMELYAMPAATQTLLDDSAVNIDEWIAEEVRVAFGEQESTAFVTGNGVNKPTGFLSYTNVAESSWSWGNIGYIATGTDGDFDATAPGDVLMDTIYAVRAAYRQNAHFVMNRQTQAEIRKIKDADGNYLWQPAVSADASATLLNVPIAESEDMPDIASDSFSIAFGDFGRGYLVVDRIGVRILRDPFSSKPYVLFYT
ncbi:MAG: phage major capsid protein, partial [Rhodobiaceae bacterium]|nr:phage major capsid protein [Rhodobiaceae bacterium]